MGYLKAVGVLRLLSSHLPGRIRGYWKDNLFGVDSPFSIEDVIAFLWEAYAPTPILNPWNNGAGFDGKSDTAQNALNDVAAQKGCRWQRYRDALHFVDERYVKTGVRKRYLDVKDKHGFIRDLRAHCPESMLPWLDAAVVLMPDDLAFPYLLGSGGNDGRLDFSVNFAVRALSVCGDSRRADGMQMLVDSLNESTRARLVPEAAIGQFSPRCAGGANSTSGFIADSIVNPWDYILLIEGALLFSGAVGRRTDRTAGRSVFPFAIRGLAGGYGSASDQETVRGEIWLPVWDGFASIASVTDLLRKGRVDLPLDRDRSVVQSAALASEAASAVVTRGAPLGVRRFERISFAQRNGLAFSATRVTSVNTGDRFDGGIAVLSRTVASWVERIRRREFGGNVREALRRFDDTLLGFNAVPQQKSSKARARQELLVSIADVDRALKRAQADSPSAPRLDSTMVDWLDDGTPVHRIALAVASLGGLRQDTDTRTDLQTASDNPIVTLREILNRRVREESKTSEAGWFRATRTVLVSDMVDFLEFDMHQRIRFNQLLRAYSLIRLNTVEAPSGSQTDERELPAAYAVLKLVFDYPRTRDVRLLRLLFTGSISRALAFAVHRSRLLQELPAPVRDVSRVELTDVTWAAAALAVPIDRTLTVYRHVLNAALVRKTRAEDTDLIRAYLATT